MWCGLEQPGLPNTLFLDCRTRLINVNGTPLGIEACYNEHPE